MAGHDDGDGVVSHGTPYGLGGHAGQSPLPCDPARDVPIGHGVTEGDGAQNLPHRKLEVGADLLQGRGEVRSPTGEVDVEPPPRGVKDRQIPFLRILRDLVAEKFFAVKPEPDQALAVASQGDGPQGRRVASKVLHGVSSSYRRP